MTATHHQIIPYRSTYFSRALKPSQSAVPGPHLAADYKRLVEGAVRRVWESSQTRLAIVIVSENGGTAIAVTDGKATHSRAYAYGGTDLAGAPEWASGWGMSMGWRLLTAGE